MALLMESICLKGHRGMPSLRQSLFIICVFADAKIQWAYILVTKSHRTSKKKVLPLSSGNICVHAPRKTLCHAFVVCTCCRRRNVSQAPRKVFFFMPTPQPTATVAPRPRKQRSHGRLWRGVGRIHTKAFRLSSKFFGSLLLPVIRSLPISHICMRNRLSSDTCDVHLSPSGLRPARPRPPSAAGGSAPAGSRW